jgi:predicted enzyme related to lactoylglutathione lyase
MLLLYVADPSASSKFYSDLLGDAPVEASPNFAMFALPGGSMLGLWARDEVAPAATQPGGSEIGFTVDDDEAVRRTHAEWTRRGMPIAQEPVAMDFGFTFVATDPDGHRLRVFAPSMQ